MSKAGRSFTEGQVAAALLVGVLIGVIFLGGMLIPYTSFYMNLEKQRDNLAWQLEEANSKIRELQSKLDDQVQDRAVVATVEFYVSGEVSIPLSKFDKSLSGEITATAFSLKLDLNRKGDPVHMNWKIRGRITANISNVSINLPEVELAFESNDPKTIQEWLRMLGQILQQSVKLTEASQ